MSPATLSLISLLLGLIAWILPVLILIKHKTLEKNKGFICSVISVSACAISLFFHILDANYEINRGDWSALGDWADAVRLPSILLIVTLVLNIIAVVILNWKDKRSK